tara:strand:+ start:157 stop:420 length:264 start_codon:yes stop_codon:yes gene_type:complete
MSKKIYIENCEYTFEYKCPLEWKNLRKTKDSKVRFCGECDKNVYRCKTDEDIDKHIELNHCVAIDGPIRAMGMMLPPEKYPIPKDLK